MNLPTRTSSLGEQICRKFLPIIKLSPTTKQNYLEFLFEHRHVEYLLKEGITNSDGMHFRPGIYHRANEEPSYENRLGSENYGAWLHDPIDGTAYVYVNTYFKPRAGLCRLSTWYDTDYQIGSNLWRHGLVSWIWSLYHNYGLILGQNLFTEARISSADLVHLNGFGLSLWKSINSTMPLSSSSTDQCPPRCSCWRDNSANHRSIWSIHEADVGVQWTCPWGRRATPSLTPFVLWVASLSMIIWTSSPSAIVFSMTLSPSRNSDERWCLSHVPMPLPVAVSSAANKDVVPWRLSSWAPLF